MKATTAKRQNGMTFANFLLVAILLIFLAIGGMKVVPAYMEDRTIRSILDTIAHDPDMQDASLADIRNSFDKRAMINNINEVSSSDIVIQKTPVGLVLSVKYSAKIGLVGNASLLLEFDTSSARAR